MEIYKMIADVMPERCLECPLCGKRDCGEQVEREDGPWTHVYNAPDDRCAIETLSRQWGATNDEDL